MRRMESRRKTIEPCIEVRVASQDREAQETRDLADLAAALCRTPREIPSKFFYDEAGSELFERITELPEYYQTRTERALLESIADRLVEASGATELVEIGAGAATKTRVLLDALERAGRLRLYVPLDVDESMVRRVAAELTAEYPGLCVHGVVGDFMAHLGHIPDGGGPEARRLVLFLGGTLGNLRPEAARRFLEELRSEMAPGDSFLLGADLVKPVARLEAAYDDAAGVTAEFNRNILNVVNRRTGGDFDPTAFRHRALYDRERCWIEMRLVSLQRQEVQLPALGLSFTLEEGEEILTEISAKYDRLRLEELLRGAGFEPVAWFIDPEGLFGLSLSRAG
ncbi:MAG TPA: L-histidine N(alpha)-methyltransferase [Thermoanaerobaculia bacterium]|nr:L-histidine N(alpha)-methyltransferase [Thermoanaerobaculia bacterium]